MHLHAVAGVSKYLPTCSSRLCLISAANISSFHVSSRKIVPISRYLFLYFMAGGTYLLVIWSPAVESYNIAASLSSLAFLILAKYEIIMNGSYMRYAEVNIIYIISSR